MDKYIKNKNDNKGNNACTAGCKGKSYYGNNQHRAVKKPCLFIQPVKHIEDSAAKHNGRAACVLHQKPCAVHSPAEILSDGKFENRGARSAEIRILEYKQRRSHDDCKHKGIFDMLLAFIWHRRRAQRRNEGKCQIEAYHNKFFKSLA